MNTTPPTGSPDAAPAHALWVQLATRITTQPLHYRSGEEETAARSIHSLFEKVRELLVQHPDAVEFRQLSVRLLNDTLRAYTARWHGWMTADKERRDKDGQPVLRFRDEQVLRQFRQELGELRPHLRAVRQQLAELAGIVDPPTGQDAGCASLGESLRAGIEQQVEIKLEPTAASAGKAQVVMQVPGKLASPTEINRAEQATLLERRIKLGTVQAGDLPQTLAEFTALPPEQPALSARAEQVVLTDAIGLALSGGGIRSATFCLGIVQVLVRKKLLPQFDYLSTVSGGGYFGSFLSCALGTRSGGDGASTTPAVSQERGRSRGNETQASKLTKPLHAGSYQAAAEAKLKEVFHRQEEESQLKGVESGLVRHLRNSSKYLLGGGFLGKMTIVGLLLSGVLWNGMMVLPIPLGCALMAFLVGPWVWGAASSTDLPFLPSLTGSPVGWVLLGLAGVLALSWMALPGIQLATHGQPPKSERALFRSGWERWTVCVGLVTAAVGLIYLLPVLFHGHEWLRTTLKSLHWGDLHLGDAAGLMPASLTGLAGASLAALAGWLGPQWPRLRGLAVKLFILSGPLLFLLVFLLVANRMGLGRAGEAIWSPLWVALIAVLLGIWDWFFVNINTLAPHRYYRNRICECYLVRRRAPDAPPVSASVQRLSGETVQGSVEVLKHIPLTDLGADSTAPYHLLNMTVNVPSSANKNLRGRASDFFLASRHFYGSPLTGYARTEDLKQTDPHFDLGTAMAVSGAAASTSMGWQSLPHLRFLMTLFNVRLGYWLRRPGERAIHRFLEGAGPWYLFREMIGRMDENCRYVNLSDGGHIENLATYELLRRRCKFIVCVDAGHEPSLDCTDVIRLQRYAEIDLGLRMYFDTADLQIGPNGYSRAHAILVKIDYAPNPTTRDEVHGTSDQLGWMLYLKLAMTGVESNHVKGYRHDHAAFPHESTGDQIYEEEQFEAYRALGECAMDGLFRQEIVGDTPPTTVRAWFQSLANNLLPDNDQAFPKASAVKPAGPTA
jgi:hypothetical protein